MLGNFATRLRAVIVKTPLLPLSVKEVEIEIAYHLGH